MGGSVGVPRGSVVAAARSRAHGTVRARARDRAAALRARREAPANSGNARCARRDGVRAGRACADVTARGGAVAARGAALGDRLALLGAAPAPTEAGSRLARRGRAADARAPDRRLGWVSRA